MEKPNREIQYSYYNSGRWEIGQSSAVVEQPVSLTVNGEMWLTFMCTPIDLEAMAVGFLFNEDLIQSNDEIADVRLCPQGDNVDVWLHHDIEKPATLRRTSGCAGGFTGIESSFNLSKPKLLEGNLTPAMVCELMSRLLESQSLYRQSGGIHTSALSDGKQIITVAEDIGRHNTLDKIAGFCLMKNKQNLGPILLTTGRISSEMLQKSARIGACMVISRTAASSLALQLAEAWGITLIGYTRRDRFNIYTHKQRILTTPTLVGPLR